MGMSTWLDDLPVLGKLPPEQAAVLLHEVGEDEAANMLEQMSDEDVNNEAPVFKDREYRVRRRLWPFQDKAWQHTAHVFGYIAPASGNNPLPICSVSNIQADRRLRKARIRITLSRLHVAAYPGGGTHQVLLHFFAQNQLPGHVEPVHFNATYRVKEGNDAGVQGYPIFLGLHVGTEGLILRCRTINVTNEQDTAFLDFLESDVFKAGLKLVSTVQPALAPFSEMALGTARAIAGHHRNVSVQDFDLGLDFGNLPLGARLATGAYLAVQIPEYQLQDWDWSEWVYRPDKGQIVKHVDPRKTIPYNYLV
jgi:hypothetical protein